MNPNDPNSSYDPTKPQRDPSKPYNEPFKPHSTEPSKIYPAGQTPGMSHEPLHHPNGGPKDYTQGPKEPLRDRHIDSKDDTSKEKYKDHAKQYGDKIEDKFKDTVKNIQESGAYHYATSNKEQTVTYILLVLGIILLFFREWNLFGGLLIGMVAGYHFSSEIVYYLRNLKQIFEGQDQLRYIVLTGLLVGLFIAAPGIFLGAAIVGVFKQLIFTRKDQNWEQDRNNSNRPNDNSKNKDRDPNSNRDLRK